MPHPVPAAQKRAAGTVPGDPAAERQKDLPGAGHEPAWPHSGGAEVPAPLGKRAAN